MDSNIIFELFIYISTFSVIIVGYLMRFIDYFKKES